jgi:hypothetical protein
MSNGIEAYLYQLKDALAGCDPATIQDALSDAEEHLRTALEQALAGGPEIPESDQLERIIEKYGTADEVAAAYREIESRTKPALARSNDMENRSFAARFFGVMADPRAYAALLYMLFSLVTGIVYFTWALTGLSLSAGLIVLIVGLPFIGLFLLSIRGITLVEGRLVEALLGVRMPRRPLFARKGLGWWGGFKALITDRITWTAIAYMIIQLPLGIIYFTLFLTLAVSSLWCIGRPVVELVFDFPIMVINDIALYTPGWTMLLAVVVGIMLLIATMHLVKLVGRMHGALAKALLVRD